MVGATSARHLLASSGFRCANSLAHALHVSARLKAEELSRWWKMQTSAVPGRKVRLKISRSLFLSERSAASGG